MLYQVTGQVVVSDGEWAKSIGFPTFYLNSDVQGIANTEHAEKIAKDVLNPAQLPNMVFHLDIKTVLEV